MAPVSPVQTALSVANPTNMQAMHDSTCSSTSPSQSSGAADGPTHTTTGAGSGVTGAGSGSTGAGSGSTGAGRGAIGGRV